MFSFLGLSHRYTIFKKKRYKECFTKTSTIENSGCYLNNLNFIFHTILCNKNMLLPTFVGSCTFDFNYIELLLLIMFELINGLVESIIYFDVGRAVFEIRTYEIKFYLVQFFCGISI